MRRTIRGGLFLPLPGSKYDPEIFTLPAPPTIGIQTEGSDLCVSDGDLVRIGDRLTVRDGLYTLSPISGTVKIENGILWVDNDNQNTENPDPIPHLTKGLGELTPADVIDALREAAIPAASGEPLWRKLERAGSGCYLAAIPAFDPEPYFPLGANLAAAYAERLVDLLKLILMVFSAGQGRILLSFSDRRGQKKIRDAIGNFSSKIKIQKVLPVYPAHLDRPLFSLLTGKELGYKKTPEQAGVLILTPAEALAIADLFFSGQRYTHSYVFIDGVGVEPQLIKVPVGTRIADLPEISDRLRRTRIVENGLMRGSMVTPENFVRPATHALTVIRPPAERTVGSCIGCDRCFRVCPMYLSPRMILSSDIREDSPLGDLLSRTPVAGFLGVSRKGGYGRDSAAGCIGCGCCSYICPANLPLAENIAKLKKQKVSSIRAEVTKE